MYQVIIRKVPFFLLLIAAIVIPFMTYKIKWLAGSVPCQGIMQFKGKSITGALEHSYSVISYVVGRDTLWFNGNDNVFFTEGAAVPVRYQKSNPEDARVNIFTSIWGDTLVYGGIPVVILLMLFLHPQVVPWGSSIKIVRKSPFLFLETGKEA